MLTRPKKNESVQFWFENVTEMNFPRFHLRLDHRGNETFLYDQSQCVFGNNPLVKTQCAVWRGMQPPQNQCIAFEADQLVAKNDWQMQDAVINCNIFTQGLGVNGNTMMAYELEGEKVFSWGGMPFMSTWFMPNNMIWIFLEKNLWESSHLGLIQLWKKDLVYHSDITTPNFYNMTTLIGSFFVQHLERMDIYNGWMTVGDIGGIAFFMVVIHTIVMIFIGLFMHNSSSFLNGENHH